jgi:Protein of unknown function (DUF4232)
MRDEVPEARPDDVELSLSWRSESGGLAGHVEARNVCEHRVRLSSKPAVTPVGLDGEPLDAGTVVTAELRVPGYVELAPGERARAPVGWGGWDGPPASGTVIIALAGGKAEVVVDGPPQPESRGPATNLSTSWFERMT